MKKLLLVLVFVTPLFALSYGPTTLVYKITYQLNPAIEWATDANYASVGPDKWTGYLVFDFCDVNAVSLYSPPTLIYYYQDSEGKWSYSLDANLPDTYTEKFNIVGTNNNKGVYIYLYWDPNDNDHGYASVYSKCAKVDIGKGPKEKPDVPQSFKGIVETWYSGYDGFGNMTASLDTKWTQTANIPDPNYGFDGNTVAFLDPNSGSSDPKAKGRRGLINWLSVVQGYQED